MRLLAAAPSLALLGACTPAEEVCTDEEDNDGDRAIDCEDDACAGRPDCRGALVFPDAFVDRHYWFLDEDFERRDLPATTSFEWGGDLDGDGLSDVSVPRNWAPAGDPLSLDFTADVVAVPSSWIVDHDLIDLDGPYVSLEGPCDALWWPASTSLCDVDGDGFDDLVHVDSLGCSGEDWPGARPQSVSLLLGGSGPDWPAEPMVLPADWFPGDMIVQCAGDLDGDGAGDIVLSSAYEHWLLDGRALAAGTAPEQAVRRHWNARYNRDMVAPGDLDGDGFDDLYFRNELDTSPQDDVEWRYGAVLLGGSHLGIPDVAELGIYDEQRPAIDVFVEAQPLSQGTYLSSHFDGAFFADIDGDGAAEFFRSRIYPNRGEDGWRLDGLLDPGGAVHLRPAQAVVHLANSGDAGIREFWGADLDGDGVRDIVAEGGGLIVPGSIPWTGEGEPRAGGLVVFFGVGTREPVDLAWEDADVFVPTDGQGFGYPRIVEDRDGDGLLEIGYVDTMPHPPGEPGELPTAAFVPGSALVAFKR